VVLYVHGATFPSALSVGWRMQGVSWLDALQKDGFDAWALDFAGYGNSDRPGVFAAAAWSAAPYGRLGAAKGQIGAVLGYLRSVRPEARIHLIAHSWGTRPAQASAIAHPQDIASLVLFGPVAVRQDISRPEQRPAWSLIDKAHQVPRHRTGLPDNVATPVDGAEIDRWCEAYLASDPASSQRRPQAVKVPGGPGADIAEYWSGTKLVDSESIRQPVLIVRGEWDHVTTDEDARYVFDSLTQSSDRRDVKISGGNHWLHLQPRRLALWQEASSFLLAQ
jgi:pimeloyl-ACP methyl ester carboxylesterase